MQWKPRPGKFPDKGPSPSSTPRAVPTHDMIVGDSRCGPGAARRAGHYVDLTEFFNANKLGEVMAPTSRSKYYAEYR